MGGWFHASVSSVQRSKGHAPMTAKAAYRAAEEIRDLRTGEIHDYTRKRGVLASDIALPAGAPAWMRDRPQLWNAAEAAEKRKDSQVGRELRFSVPADVSRQEQERIARELAAFVVAKHRAAVDWTLHAPDPKGDERNVHVHMLISARRVGRDGFTDKMPELDDRRQSPATVERMRAEVAAAINRSYERQGSLERVDHRSFERRGIDQEPTRHLGPAASAKERRGEPSRIGNDNRAAVGRNREQAERERSARVIDLELEREKRRAAFLAREGAQAMARERYRKGRKPSGRDVANENKTLLEQRQQKDTAALIAQQRTAQQEQERDQKAEWKKAEESERENRLDGDAWEFLQRCTLSRLAAGIWHEGELAVER